MNTTPLHDPKREFYRTTLARLGIEIGADKPQTWVHEPKCTKRTQEALDRLNAWNEEWPNACTQCDGHGLLTVHDSVPYGSGNVNMQSEELCDCCLERGACPRCGEMILATDEQFEDFWENMLPCPLCGWNWSKALSHPGQGLVSQSTKSDTRPEVPECYCWEAQEWT